MSQCALRSEDDKAITIDQFIAPDALDRIYQTGRSYYLVPEGRVGERPFAILRQGMEEEKRYAIAQVVLHGKEQLVLLRPQGKVLLMTVLDRQQEVTKPTAFEELAPKAEAPQEELHLTKTLIVASTWLPMSPLPKSQERSRGQRARRPHTERGSSSPRRTARMQPVPENDR